jgi:hypothetical protein
MLADSWEKTPFGDGHHIRFCSGTPVLENKQLAVTFGVVPAQHYKSATKTCVFAGQHLRSPAKIVRFRARRRAGRIVIGSEDWAE